MKKILTLLIILLISCSAVSAFGKKKENKLDVLPLMTSQSEEDNRVWVGTFQLAWNDFMDEIIGGSVHFVGHHLKLLDELNKQAFKAEELSDSAYYKKTGAISPELKIEMEKAIKEKFNETSDILDLIDWKPGKNKFIAYAMLKKDFKFLTAFDVLKKEKFAKSKEKIGYFGINEKSDQILRDMVIVMFYNSKDDFAVQLRTDGNDAIYIYRTNDNKTFDKLYTDMFIKQANYVGLSKFGKKDELKIPDIDMFAMKSFEELKNKEIKGKNGMMISDAVETIEFKMNNEGVKLKSEAAIATMMSAPIIMKEEKPKKFYFDDTFVIILKEKDKNKPYFALRVKDAASLNKTAKD